jgi:hypothetical protein
MSTTPATTRHAVVRGRAADVDAIRRYLPSNYTADHDGGSVWIHGVDSAGWTLDSYVIPRLASGMYRAQEIPAVPGLTPPRVAHVMALGDTMLAEAGESACREGYGTTDPFWVGHYALGYGDISETGALQ